MSLKTIVDRSDQWRLMRRWQRRNGKTHQIFDFWVMHTWGKHHREFWAFYIFHFTTQTGLHYNLWIRPPWSLANCRCILNSNSIFSWIKKEKCLKLSNPKGWFVWGQNFSNSQILKWLKRNFKLGALFLFSPNNVIPKYYHISFHDCLWNLIWQFSKERSKFWLQWSWSFIIKEICLVLKYYDFPKWLFKWSHLVQKKNGNLIFFQKKKKGKKKEKSHFKKKKKIILFQNPVLLNYVLTWSSMKEVRRQPFKGPVPITQITLKNKFKTMWQNCLGAC